MTWAHILPQFYLEGFLDPVTPPGYDPYVWVADLRTSGQARAPHNAAAETDYYKVDTTIDRDLDPEGVERRLAILEGQAASALREVLAAPCRTNIHGTFDHRVRRTSRGPCAVDATVRGGCWHQYVLDDAEKLNEEQPDSWMAVRDVATGAVTRERFKDAIVRIREGTARATMTRNPQLDMMWAQAAWFQQVHLPAMRWTIVAQPSPAFITSDRAVAWMVPGSDYGATDHPGAVSNDGAEVTVALSSTVALFGMKSQAPVGKVHPDVFIERTSALAERFIIAPTRPLLERALEMRTRHLSGLAEARARPRVTGPLPPRDEPSGDG